MRSSSSLKSLVDEPQTEEGPLHCWDDMAVEVEVAEFLHSLVRLLKPQRVVESGSGRGLASLHIAAALKENGSGELLTFEPLGEYQDQARKRLHGYPAHVLPGSTLDYDGETDLVFLDSGPTREQEIDAWLETEVALVVHDSHRYTLPGGMTFPTARGLWLRL